MKRRKQRKLTKPQKALLLEHKLIAERIAMKHSKWKAADRADREDLINTAVLALAEATRTWDPERSPFRPYAIKQINWALLASDYEHSYNVYLPNNVHNQVKMIRKAIFDGAETIMAVSQATGLNPSKVRELWHFRNSGGTHTDFETLDKPSSDVPTEEKVVVNSEKFEVRAAISQLPMEQRAVIRARFGFTTGLPMTTDEIADYLGVFLDDVRDVEEEAMEHLKAILSDW